MSEIDAGLFDAILQSFLTVLRGGFLRLGPDARRLLSLLATLELSLAAVFWLFATEEAVVHFLRLILRIGGDEGEAFKAQARKWFTEQGVVNRARMIKYLSPGFTEFDPPSLKELTQSAPDDSTTSG